MADASPDNSPTAGDSQWSADELVPFGKYMLLDRLSSGATAAVYRAKARGEAGFERVIAVKRILPHMAGDPEFVNTFVREAKTAARLTHNNICPIYELGKVGESLYMAMECIAGRDLGSIQRRLAKLGETMPPILAAWVAARLCDALDYAHNLKTPSGDSAGVIHRDLSPTNIVISYEGQVKLIDFGLAKAVGRAQQTNVDALKAKLGYMSPEMVRGKPLDARSDIFGVGICLYEMLTARRLFAGKDDMATLKLVGAASVPPPSALTEDPPEELELIIMRALERDPEDRWQSAAEMGQALNRYITSTDPMFDERKVAEWMSARFAAEQAEEAERIRRLVAASNDEEIVRQRRQFFASPTGAAAMAKAEVMRRLSTEPPPIAGPKLDIPAAAPLPAQIKSDDDDEFEDEPTGFYDNEKTEAVDVSAADLEKAAARDDDDKTRADRPLMRDEFEDEPTGFYDEDKTKAAAPLMRDEFEDEPTGFYDGADPSSPSEPAARSAPEPPPARASLGPATDGFVDEATQYLSDGELDTMTVEEEGAAAAPAPARLPVAAVVPGTDFDFDEEEPTEIFFNKEEGIGEELLMDIEEVAPIPQNAPMVDPSLAYPRPAAPAPMGAAPAPAGLPPQAGRAQRTTIEMRAPVQKRSSALWPLLLGLLFLAVAVAAVAFKTSLGARLGLRDADVGSIEIRTTPAVPAAVKLDDVYRGRAPIRMDGVKGGKRRIEVVAEGYMPAIREVDLRGGTTALVDISLVQARPTMPEPEPPKPEAGASADAADEASSEGGEDTTAKAPPTGSTKPGSSPKPRPRPRPAPRPAPDRPGGSNAPAASGDPGTLVVNTIPWSRVFIDGKDTGRNTPIFGMDLKPGRHVIGLRTPDGKLHTETVKIKSGETVKLIRRYD